jgi:hypothetical protein
MGDDKNVTVKVDADNGLGWAVLVLGMIVLFHGDPDLLDVLAKWCQLWMKGAAP